MKTQIYMYLVKAFINYKCVPLHLMIMMGPTDSQIALDANTQDEEYRGAKCHSGG